MLQKAATGQAQAGQASVVADAVVVLAEMAKNLRENSERAQAGHEATLQALKAGCVPPPIG